ncbi:MAG: exopolyphosphatase, partial [Bacteroidetes bacterium]
EKRVWGVLVAVLSKKKKPMSRYAVIDLGTNTFHLLIVEKSTPDAPPVEVYRERRFVKLAEAGIEKIGPEPWKRGIETIEAYAQKIKEWKVGHVRAVGTAALREAENGAAFIREIFDRTGIAIELISGEEEARLIYLGVRAAISENGAANLIMDIGGGSVEFIFFDQKGIQKAFSFPVGVAVLYRKFHRHEPILPEEINALETFLTQTLKPLIEELPRHTSLRLIGASGAFEVVENMLETRRRSGPVAYAPASDFSKIYSRVVGASLEERLQMEGIPAIRADLIVVAFILIRFILERADIKEIVVCDYALKEGVLFEMFEAARD